MTWQRHVNQLKKCFNDTAVSHTEQEPTYQTSVSEGEEEDGSTSGVTEVWSNSNSPKLIEHSSPNVTAPSITYLDVISINPWTD